MRRTTLFFLLIAICFPATAAQTVRVGALEFGTVNWELQLLRERGLAEAQGIELEVLPLASKEAASVALQAGAVDMIVSDWLWVSKQRAHGSDLTFVPHSLAVGGLMVPADSAARTIDDLAGKRIGVAGGPDDKSWLLLRAWAIQQHGKDPENFSEVSFAAPPLLNALAERGKLDAALNYWHYNARLAAKGMRKLLDVEDVLPALGVERTPPLLGWTFSEAWARENPAAIRGFLDASWQAKRLLRDSDIAWQSLRPVMHVDDEAAFIALRDGYRDGIPDSYGPADIRAAERMFEVLVRVAGPELTGGKALAPGTFWRGYAY